MLDFETARQRFIQVAPRLGNERVLLTAAAGRVLAEPLRAPRAVPEFDTSAMDGYAINVEDVKSVPYCLSVEGEAAAGSAPGQLRRGTAMRIFTGAALPVGANAVVMQECVNREGKHITGNEPVARGQHIRQRGEDLAESTQALDRGQRLRPPVLALASFLDACDVTVVRAPTVSILCTGSELRHPGADARPGTIAESNSATVSLLAQQAGANILRVELVDDNAERTRAAIDRALSDSDVTVTIGGVSVGDYDFVRPALDSAGVVLDLYKVAIKPGKPITLGRMQDKVVIGLPGNPASAVITFALFGIPLLRAMQGDQYPVALPVWVPLSATLNRDNNRTRVILGNLMRHQGLSGFSPHVNQSSGTTVALGQSDGFIILEPGRDSVPVGTLLPYHRWTDL